MGCFSREKGAIEQHAKWDYINLDDFHATSSWTPFNYLWVWIFGLIGVACFGLDCFTAVNLLILDKWASGIEPAIPLHIAKWIFVGCIMFSFALYAWEWFIAIRIIRRGGVAESYMDPLAAELQCMRGKGWKRFLVFSALTKSRKGADYVAFFVHFQFDNWLRIVIAEGGRQGINAMTIWSVTQKEIAVTGSHGVTDGSSPILKFFENIGTLYQSNIRQALTLTAMATTFIIWAFWALCLLVALVLYLTWLWHYIPQSDGRLGIYCRRKIDRRLEKIVEKKLQAAFQEEERKLQRAETFGSLKPGKKSPTVSIQPVRQPTLPMIGGEADYDADAKSLSLSRMDTGATLPPYGSRPGTSQSDVRSGLSRQATLPDITPTSGMPPHLQRQGTGLSVQTYNTNASLIHNAGEMGYDSDAESPMHGPRSGSAFGYRGPPARSMTGSTMGSQGGYGPPAPRGMPPRSNTAFSAMDDRNPMSRAGSAMAGPTYPPPMRTYTPDSYAIQERPSREQTPFSTSDYAQGSQRPAMAPRRSFSRPFAGDDQRPSSPATREPTPPMPAPPSKTPSPVSANGHYVAFNPLTSYRSPSVPAAAQPRPLQMRSPTNPVELQNLDHGQRYGQMQQPQRSYTAPIRGPSPPQQYDDGRF